MAKVNATGSPGVFESKSIGDLEERVLQTLHLADRRGYGLTLSNISKMLFHGAMDEDAVSCELDSMQSVSHSFGIYCLKGSESLLPVTREKLLCNEMIAKKYEALAKDFVSEYASFSPFIRFIAIAGSMASGGFSEDDDIDFNIIVEKGCKYTVYLSGILLSIKYSIRHRKKPLARKSATPFLSKLICINVIWEDWESLPFWRQDKYMAYELLNQKPVFGLRFYRTVIQSNQWLETYFPQIYDTHEIPARITPVPTSLAGRLMRLFYSNRTASSFGEMVCRKVSYVLWRIVQFSRRNNPDALARVRLVNEMQKPYSLFGDRV
ncbi:MAG: hypothetical protein J5U17_03265 [Candidatus Methanoperedens sp.]|nr:hypothetical protein [Candidatus Methanoperedens sp.]MCE8424782.1 hypothetical protein [Candidatus Methanoperedens sp.]MCE8427084.1 hypothetical protein [Candidatus Methanoperedens sp.]